MTEIRTPVSGVTLLCCRIQRRLSAPLYGRVLPTQKQEQVHHCAPSIRCERTTSVQCEIQCELARTIANAQRGRYVNRSLPSQHATCPRTDGPTFSGRTSVHTWVRLWSKHVGAVFTNRREVRLRVTLCPVVVNPAKIVGTHETAAATEKRNTSIGNVRSKKSPRRMAGKRSWTDHPDSVFEEQHA